MGRSSELILAIDSSCDSGEGIVPDRPDVANVAAGGRPRWSGRSR